MLGSPKIRFFVLSLRIIYGGGPMGPMGPCGSIGPKPAAGVQPAGGNIQGAALGAFENPCSGRSGPNTFNSWTNTIFSQIHSTRGQIIFPQIHSTRGQFFQNTFNSWPHFFPNTFNSWTNQFQFAKSDSTVASPVAKFHARTKCGLAMLNVGKCEIINSGRNSCQHPQHQASGPPSQ